MNKCRFFPEIRPRPPRSASQSLLLVVEGDGRCNPAACGLPALRSLVDDHPPAVDQEVVEVVQDAVRGHLPVEGVGVGGVFKELLLLAAGQPHHLVTVPHL